jgi:hypothetical protein
VGQSAETAEHLPPKSLNAIATADECFLRMASFRSDVPIQFLRQYCGSFEKPILAGGGWADARNSSGCLPWMSLWRSASPSLDYARITL